jgi:hypothetical protein
MQDGRVLLEISPTPKTSVKIHPFLPLLGLLSKGGLWSIIIHHPLAEIAAGCWGSSDVSPFPIIDIVSCHMIGGLIRYETVV